MCACCLSDWAAGWWWHVEIPARNRLSAAGFWRGSVGFADRGCQPRSVQASKLTELTSGSCRKRCQIRCAGHRWLPEVGVAAGASSTVSERGRACTAGEQDSSSCCFQWARRQRIHEGQAGGQQQRRAAADAARAGRRDTPGSTARERAAAARCCGLPRPRPGRLPGNGPP